ncbi:Quinol monooxygenase YgiN [Zobellia uliginosa]|uniref:Quinol monooxygenase YgiN n=1 Tax=Zobellia uliginosa TaxID=143224 RepID=A0ABY1KSV4_9FLAO|nr:putative quinol monooxygenase [Zobellia uliginosa]SIS72680.1 Quinol monooxygenase YgiN [Zobellia uliginosa]
MKKSYLTIVAKIVVKEGHREFVKAELLKLLDSTRAEEGNICYDLHQDNENPDFFLFFERWVNRELWQAHMENEQLAHYLKVTEGKIEEFTLNEMTEIIN